MLELTFWTRPVDEQGRETHNRHTNPVTHKPTIVYSPTFSFQTAGAGIANIIMLVRTFGILKYRHRPIPLILQVLVTVRSQLD